MKSIHISKVMPSELVQLQKLSRQTFYEAFSENNMEENMKKYLDEELSLEKLTIELNEPNSEFYFARWEDEIIAYLKLNFGQSQTEIKDEKAVEIERIYVLKEFQRKNIGQILLEKAIQVSSQNNASYVFLGVWEENLGAIGFYKKNGFLEFDKHIFILGEDEQTDIMMKLFLYKS